MPRAVIVQKIHVDAVFPYRLKSFQNIVSENQIHKLHPKSLKYLEI